MGSGPSPERFGIPGTALGEKELSGWGNHPGISPGTVRVPRSPPGSTDPKQAGEAGAGRVCPHKADFWNGSGLFPIPPGIRALFQSFPAAQSAAEFPPALPNHHLPFAFFPPLISLWKSFGEISERAVSATSLLLHHSEHCNIIKLVKRKQWCLSFLQTARCSFQGEQHPRLCPAPVGEGRIPLSFLKHPV